MVASPIFALKQAAAQDRGFIGSSDKRLGFAELDRAASRFANFLSSHGVNVGDRVAGILLNSADFIVAWLGTLKLGAVWAPVNTAFTGEWLRHQLADTDPVVIIVDEALHSAFDAIASELGSRKIIVRGGGAGISFDDYQKASDAEPDWAPKPSDLAMLIYTSGTTGRSKGCMVSHAYLCNYSRLQLQNLSRTADDVLWTPMPLFHLAGVGHALSTIMLGGKGYLAPQFSVSTFWDEIEKAEATFVPTLGIAATLLAAAPDNDASRRCKGQVRVLTGATSPDVQATLRERFGVREAHIGAFGQTEGSFFATLRDHEPRNGSSGPATDSFDVRVVDELDNELPRGEIGEIVYRPTRPWVMFSGYWRNPEATAAKCRNLWWHSGDFGRMDEDGHIYFADRGDDRLRRSGENVSSFEVENLFAQHPAVAVPAVHAVPSELSEDEIKLSVILREGHSISEEELWGWGRARMPKFAAPRFIEFRMTLPRNPVGKILKYELRNEGVTATTWDSRSRRRES